jgi:hypothetical protein
VSSHGVPLIIRGQIFEQDALAFSGRRGAAQFTTPDVRKHLRQLALIAPSQLADLYQHSFAQLLDLLGALGARLSLRTNPHLQAAFELACETSGLSEAILRHHYETLHEFFDRTTLQEMVERTIGIKYLEGWVESALASGGRASVRAFGARAVHIVAGNVPGVSAISIARNVVTRSDAIIKSPSNDPLTAAAIARTLIELAPEHPVTRHLSVAYWKGGDPEVEAALYQPRNIEKIIAWGGLASVTHIAKYIQPGIDLITLDPKLSSTIIGREAFADEGSMREVAERLANDVGVFNQEACVNARVVYIETGTDERGLATATRFGAMLYDAIQTLPAHTSGPAKTLDRELADEVETLKLASDSHKVIGGGANGAVIVSQLDEPVDFSRRLANRVANLVPVDSLETPIRAVTAYTQTIGIYPETLKPVLRDRLAFHGAQRIVSLGYATRPVLSGPQDAIEPLRRMCRWIIDETCDPTEITLPSRTSSESRPSR